MTTPLTLNHLRFDVVARSPLKLGGHQAGERLRDALARVMLRAVCPETRRSVKPAPEHAAACPACWLLAYEAEHGAQASGEVRRIYSLVPPFPLREVVEPGESFSFTLTLFGDGFQYLPYFVLAVPEMGREGVGPGRGQFDLEAIWAINPLRGETQAVMQPGENVVRAPKVLLDWPAVQETSQRICEMASRTNRMQIDFLSPTRLIDDGALVKTPDFGVFFRRLLQRIDQVSQQHAGQTRRSLDEVENLHTLADQVRLIESDVQWVDIWGPSKRTGRRTPMGGFVGTAVYRARQWEPLLPWLILGQGVQVGKLSAKGNGVYQIKSNGMPAYWESVVTGQFA